ncbi:MAG: hypothetical protein WCS42_12490, partial [Verrucomicrobiota bacterium]
DPKEVRVDCSDQGVRWVRVGRAHRPTAPRSLWTDPLLPIQHRLAVMVGAPSPLAFGWWRLASGLTLLCAVVLLDPFGLGISRY